MLISSVISTYNRTLEEFKFIVVFQHFMNSTTL